ncbi:MAG: PAS domain-containing protein [Betaproteobacteria bacterium]|jgi:PAS domain S-box-containing protein|nr:PAS domain-containing protein [Betaproteobacteria bacterium]
MSFIERSRRESTPALARLLGDAAMSRAALGACGFPVAILDAMHTARPVTYINPAFEHFFGCRSDEVLGRGLGELIFRGDEALVHRMLAEAMPRRSAKAWSRDGTLRHVELSFGPLRHADGRTNYWVVAFSDRTEVEKLRAEIESLRTLQAAA